MCSTKFIRLFFISFRPSPRQGDLVIHLRDCIKTQEEVNKEFSTVIVEDRKVNMVTRKSKVL